MQPQQLQKIAEGREAEIFAWEGDTILRLLRDPKAQQLNQWQAVAMEAARSRGVRVPAVHEVTTVLDRPGIVMERIDGADLLTLIGRQPWTVFRVGRVTGEIHAQMHDVTAPSLIPTLKATLRQRIESRSRLPQHLAQFALDMLEDLPDGDSLCHGDLTPANILMAGDTPVVIDWTIATRGDATADYVRTWLTLRIGEPPPGSSALLRAMSLVGRNLLTSAYVRSYRRRRPLDMELVSRWEIPVAAGRLGDGIEEETATLIRLLEERRAKAPGT